MDNRIDLNVALGDWRGAGYSEERASILVVRVDELMRGGMYYEDALRTACIEIPPDES